MAAVEAGASSAVAPMPQGALRALRGTGRRNYIADDADEAEEEALVYYGSDVEDAPPSLCRMYNPDSDAEIARRRATKNVVDSFQHDAADDGDAVSQSDDDYLSASKEAAPTASAAAAGNAAPVPSRSVDQGEEPRDEQFECLLRIQQRMVSWNALNRGYFCDRSTVDALVLAAKDNASGDSPVNIMVFKELPGYVSDEDQAGECVVCGDDGTVVSCDLCQNVYHPFKPDDVTELIQIVQRQDTPIRIPHASGLIIRINIRRAQWIRYIVSE